jgi:1,4-dihydroxy-2-naphthoate octaprenyltransferase
VSHWFIGVITLIGAFAIGYYTKLLAKLLLGELFAGLTLGSLVVIGAYVAMNGTPETAFTDLVPLEVWIMSVPPGILTALLLFLNEFPDAEADKKGGRNHLVIKLGKQKAAWVYVAGMVATFGTILLLPVFGISSWWVYLALLPLPLAFKASITAVKFGDNFEKMVPALGQNVMVVLATDLLIALAVFIEIF